MDSSPIRASEEYEERSTVRRLRTPEWTLEPEGRTQPSSVFISLEPSSLLAQDKVDRESGRGVLDKRAPQNAGQAFPTQGTSHPV
jgi:hypothetical protein